MKTLDQFQVFLASPGGLDEERKCFFEKLHHFSEWIGEPQGVVFKPVGWEKILGGLGRPQEQINLKLLNNADFAIFILHDRWGSRTGKEYSSGVEEEWTIAEKLFNEAKIKNIILFFKKIDDSKLKSPDGQVKKILSFRKKIIREKNHLFTDYDQLDQFQNKLDGYLAEWLLRHKSSKQPNSPTFATKNSLGENLTSLDGRPSVEISFDAWLAEAVVQMVGVVPNFAAGLFCAEKARFLAISDLEWARATNVVGAARAHLGDSGTAMALFSAAEAKIEKNRDNSSDKIIAEIMMNKGMLFDILGRHQNAIAAYEKIIVRFKKNNEEILRQRVAEATFCKGLILGKLGRLHEEIQSYRFIIEQNSSKNTQSFPIVFVEALFNSAVASNDLQKFDDALTYYDIILEKFSESNNSEVKRRVVAAMLNKSNLLRRQAQFIEAVAICDEIEGKFSASSDMPILRFVIRALLNKCAILADQGYIEESVRSSLVAEIKFGSNEDDEIQENLGMLLFNRAQAFMSLRRLDDAFITFSGIIHRFKGRGGERLKDVVANSELQLERFWPSNDKDNKPIL